MNPYWFLFIDSIKASLAFFPDVGMAYTVMKVFDNNYNQLLILFLALLGNLCGVVINYYIGVVCWRIKQVLPKYRDSQKLKNLTKFAKNYLFLLTFFSFLPLWGVILTFSAGFLRVGVIRLVLCTVVGRIFYYCLLA